MNYKSRHTNLIKKEAKRLGFLSCGISKAEFLEDEAPRLENWLNKNMHGEMSYMANHFDKRLDPTLLVPDSKSVVSLLLNYFPENTKEGFKTEALPTIWENKDEFNNLMAKSSNNMIELAAIIESSEDVKGTLGKFMWGNCKACHNKYRAPH